MIKVAYWLVDRLNDAASWLEAVADEADLRWGNHRRYAGQRAVCGIVITTGKQLDAWSTSLVHECRKVETIRLMMQINEAESVICKDAWFERHILASDENNTGIRVDGVRIPWMVYAHGKDFVGAKHGATK